MDLGAKKNVQRINHFSTGVSPMIENNERFTDLELVDKVKAGDRKAYSLLVRRHQKSLLRLCYRFVKDLDVAEDVVQESFIKAYERLKSFEGRSSFKSWLFQVAVNTAKNKLRERRDGMVEISQIQLAVAAQAETQLISRSMASTIQILVDELPIRQKTALVLRIYEDMSFKEIAEIMDCPYDTAKANFRHALLKLRAEFESRPDLKNSQNENGGLVMEINRRVAEVES